MSNSYEIVAKLLTNLRTGAGLSKARMARAFGVDERTYNKYETGASSPGLAEFIDGLQKLNIKALPAVMRSLYPDLYSGEDRSPDTEQMRRILVHFIEDVASDRDVEQLYYILNGDHGSPFEAQLQLLCALDHLPLDARLMVAKLTLNAWEITTARGDVINADQAMPDAELLRQSLITATLAVIEGRKHYKTPHSDTEQ